jgi:hypothetical protein
MGPGAAGLTRHGPRRGRLGFKILKKNLPTAFVWKNNFFFTISFGRPTKEFLQN